MHQVDVERQEFDLLVALIVNFRGTLNLCKFYANATLGLHLSKQSATEKFTSDKSELSTFLHFSLQPLHTCSVQ